jgi:hypothetical protein
MTVKKFIGVLPILAASLIFLVIAVKSPKQAAQMAVSDNVVCSEEQAFLAGDPFLELSCAGAYPIYYTLDGSIPTLDSMLYEAPITLSASDEVQSVVVRAGAYDENTGEWGDLFTHTYFYANDLQTIRERYSTYIVCVTSDPYNLYDYEYGILTEGKVRDEYVASDSYDENLLLMPANYTQRGSDWERDAHLEILNADGERLIDQDMGLRVFGNASRQAYRKSMKFYAREEYGADSFDYPLFSENVSVKSGTVQDSYKHLIVRNHGNDRSITLFREELFQTLCSRIDGTDTKSFAPAAVYLN